ncbi:MerR family transcriptional regulator [Salinisphaera orenii MK-B5]|uniref:MerR family transcriptional regulator n=1 Tax=Salinisphaera orenii MK-B5 TaxID=856730 RepID=A0A423PY75_9GAMM|nr:MerR family transcriptional regulator [Salinisphaera orenii]ROO30532.1 MerR family transcriptional regulator [Salinisphaera orenii MK-B5]
MFTIAQAARRAGCPASTIRYYERVRLLPSARRGTNGYRYYEVADIERLAFVNRARQLGFSIDAVADLLRLADHPHSPCDGVDTLIATQLHSVEKRIRQLQTLAARLRQLQSACDGEHPIRECGILAALSDTRWNEA